MTLIAICIFLNTNGQKTKVNFGIYEGSTNDLVPTTWILNEDSTFIFLSFKGKNVEYFDAGKWSVVKPGIIKFIFSDINFPILQNTSYQYSTETKQPFDSVIIKGILRSPSGNAIPNASIIVNGKYEIATDLNGYFSNTHSRSATNQNLTIIKKIDGFEILTLPLNSNTNYHQLDITMSKCDSTTANMAYDNSVLKQPLFYKKEQELRYFNTKEKNMGYNSLLFKSAKIDAIVDKLNNAKVSQPHLLSNINHLLRILTK